MIEPHRGPLARLFHGLVAHWKRWRNVRCFVDRLVQHRAVEPDDEFVVFDLRRVGAVQRGVVRREMAVRDAVIVAGPGLVDVLRRQR